MTVLDIGGGHTPVEGSINVDPVHGVPPFDRKIELLLPELADNTVHAIRASHVLEHTETSHRIAIMNEFHRVLEPGGTLTVGVPLVPSWEAYADPTHISWWCRESFLYFTGAIRAEADYGIKWWDELTWDAPGPIGKWVGTPR